MLMLSKPLFVFVACLLSLTVAAQTIQEQRKQIDRKIQAVLKRDPRIPTIQEYELNAILQSIEKYTIERKFPANVRNFQFSRDFPYPLNLQLNINKLKNFIKDRELEEVTGIRLSWFQALEACMQNIYKPLSRIREAQNVLSTSMYKDAVVDFAKQVEPLKRLLAQKTKIPAEELQEIKNRNIKYRRALQQKQIRLLQQKKRALQ